MIVIYKFAFLKIHDLVYMAKKRKTRTKTKKKNKKISFKSFFVSLRQLGILAFFAVICLIGLLFLYTCLFKDTSHKEHLKTELPEKSTPKASKKPTQSAVASTKTFHVPANTEIPALKSSQPEQVIKHEGYTVSYNSDYKIANWVAYELTSEEVRSKKAERNNKFVPDPMVNSATALNEDYSKTGYDRGHMAPAADMKWSVKAMRESFYFSNICPQKPGLNRGIWKDLEEQSRMWAMDNGAVMIVTGPVIKKDLRRLGKNRVGIPESFYKVIVYHTGKNYEGIGFLFDNKDYKKSSLKDRVVSIDSIEKMTNIDFFPSLPDSEENKMEASVDMTKWSF